MSGTWFQRRISFSHVCPFYHLVAKWLWSWEIVNAFTIILIQFLVAVIIKHCIIEWIRVTLLRCIKLLAAYALLVDRNNTAML